MKKILFISLILLNISIYSEDREWKKYLLDKDFTLELSIDSENLYIKASANTTGWIAVGFEPTKMMKGSDIIIGYVTDDGAVIEDHYGNGYTSHKSDELLGGANNVTLIGGSQKEGVTTVEFSIPLNSKDQYDKGLIPGGEYKLIYATGKKDNIKSRHNFRASQVIKFPNI